MRLGTRELGLLVLVGAIPAASWFMVFKPQGARIATDAAGLAHMEEMLEKLRAETARAADLERENAEIAGRIASIESRLPTNKQIDDVVRQVSVLAVQAGLAPPTLKVERPVAAADYREQPLKLTTSGDWSGYHGFLEKLERLPRITRVTDLSAKESTVGEGVEVDFTLSIYFRQEDGEANS